MTTRSLVFVSLLLLLVAAAANAQQIFHAVLTVSQEVPTPVGNPTGSGVATFTLAADHQSIAVDLTVSGLSTPIVAAHIHRAPFGVPGSVVVNFDAPTNFSGGHLSKTFAIPKSDGDDLAANPTNFYVNVHTTQNQQGEIRGQLTPQSTTTLLAAEMKGSNERPTPTGSTATGAALVSIDANNNVTFDVNSNVQNATLAHIHKGDANTAGSVLVNFVTPTGPATAFTNGRATGTIAIAPSDAADIKANPQNYYVNVHSKAFGQGEIRGQLAQASEVDIPIAGNVTGASGHFVTDARIFNPSFTNTEQALVEFIAAGSTSNTTATASMVVVIPPRGTAVLNDVTDTGGLHTPGQLGALRITSQGQLIASADIFNDQRSAGKGTFGQFVAGLNRSDLLLRGALSSVSNTAFNAANPTGFRTNIGLFNPNPDTAIVRLELRDASGTIVGSNTINVPALSQQQNAIGTYFPGVDLSNSPALSLSFASSSAIAVYAVNNDNASGDSFVNVATADPGVNSNQP